MDDSTGNPRNHETPPTAPVPLAPVDLTVTSPEVRDDQLRPAPVLPLEDAGRELGGALRASISGLLHDPMVRRQVIGVINGVVNIPVVPEIAEARLISAVYDLVVSAIDEALEAL